MNITDLHLKQWLKTLIWNVFEMHYNTIQYKTCNAPYVTAWNVIRRRGDDTWLGSISNVEKMSLKFMFKNISRVASSNVKWQIVPVTLETLIILGYTWSLLHFPLLHRLVTKIILLLRRTSRLTNGHVSRLSDVAFWGIFLNLWV